MDEIRRIIPSPPPSVESRRPRDRRGRAFHAELEERGAAEPRPEAEPAPAPAPRGAADPDAGATLDVLA